jgi:hypothetical protein
VTFPVTVLSPPILYNRSRGKSSRKEAAMNGKTAGNRGPWLAGALVAAAVVAVLAATFRVHVRTYISYPAGSATYRQEVAFVRCMRSHGMPDLPYPAPPAGSIAPQETQDGTAGEPSDPDACKGLAPHGRKITTIQIVL